MKFMRVSTIVTVTAAVISGTMLFATSQKVQKAERQLSKLTAEKNREQESMRVLRAEWDYLNRPDRLEALASRYLGMKQPELASVTDDPKRIAIPVPPVQIVGTPSPLAQQAVYQPAAPARAPVAVEQKNFSAVLHDLSGEDVP
jgi:cell division protein FtsL